MRRPKIAVVGSTNTDLVIRAKRLPQRGETVMGLSSAIFPGGKGANQAVAAARFNAEVCFVTRIGTDSFGDAARTSLFLRDAVERLLAPLPPNTSHSEI